MINSVQGGRGKRSPYHKTTVSVPTDIVPLIKRICNLYRNYAFEFGLDFAKKQMGSLDTQTDAIANNQADTPISLQEFELQEILKLVHEGKSGYKKNSASQLIARLKNLSTMQ